MHILLSFAFNLCGFLPLENGSSSFSKKVIPAVPCFAVRDTFSLSWHCPYIFYSASHAANVMLCRGSNSNSSPRHHHCTGWRKTLLISRIINVVIYCNGWFVPQPERDLKKKICRTNFKRGMEDQDKRSQSFDPPALQYLPSTERRGKMHANVTISYICLTFFSQ